MHLKSPQFVLCYLAMEVVVVNIAPERNSRRNDKIAARNVRRKGGGGGNLRIGISVSFAA